MSKLKKYNPDKDNFITSFPSVTGETCHITGFEVRAIKSNVDYDGHTEVNSIGITDEEAEGFGIYAHNDDGTQQWIADTLTRESAEAFAALITNICSRFKPQSDAL